MIEIDKLNDKVQEIQEDLKKVKEMVLSEAKREEKIEEIKKRAKKVKEERESKMTTLKDKTKEEAQSLLGSLNEIINLKSSIGNNNKTGNEDIQGESRDNRGFFDGAKEWIGDQRESVRDTGKWTRGKEGLVNGVRAIGFALTGGGAIAGAAALVYKGVKSLWNRAFGKEKKEDKEEETEPKKKEKTPFWDRRYGQAVKRGGIGLSVYWLAHGIFTGDWFNDLLSRGTSKTERAKDQVKKYKELSPEDREKYENVGDNVNKFYSNVREKEISYGYKSSYDLGTISEKVATDAGAFSSDEVYKGLVPFCMDDGLKNIDDLLSETNFTTYLFDKDVTEIITEIKSWSSTAFGNVLGSFVGSLDSFIPFSSGPGSLSDKIEQWIKSSPDERIDELNFFFRQYSKVLTYMKDKERAIAYKIVEEKCASDLADKTEAEKVNYIQNKLKDKDWFEENVKKDSIYQSFMNSKILNSGEVLKNSGLFDGEMSPILKEGIIEPLDDEFDDIMKVDVEGKTIVDKGIEEVDENLLGNQTQEDLIDMCNDLEKDMGYNNDGRGLFGGFSYLFNSGISNRETFLQESGLEGFINELKGKIEGIKEKIRNKSVSKDELQQLKDTALAYFAFQKEIELATYTFQSIKSDNPDASRRFIESQIIGFNNFMESLNNIYDGSGTFGDYLVLFVGGGQIMLAVSSRARRAVGGVMIDTIKRTAKKPVEAITWVAGRPTFSNAGFRKALQGLDEAPKKKSYFLHYALNGKIKNEEFLLDIAKKDLRLTRTESMGDTLLELLESTNSSLIKSDCELLWKYAGNTNIKKLVITEEDVGRGVSDALADGFKPTAKQFKVDMTNLKKLEEIDKMFSKSNMTPKARTLLEDLLHKSVHSVDDLDYLKNIFGDDDFIKCLAEIEESPKAIRGMTKHLNNVRKSTAYCTITHEIERTTVATKLDVLKNYRRSLASMSPKDFEVTEECIKLFDANGGLIDNMKIINKIVDEGIQASSGGRPKKITVEELINNTDDVIHKLRNASPNWKNAVGQGKINKFVDSLDALKQSRKIFKYSDETVTAIKTTARMVARLT